jgi:chromosome segregation ATPase
MAEKIVIAELELNTKALQESNTQLIQDIQKLRAEQKELMKDTDGLKNATDEQAKKFVENDAALKNLSNQYNNNKKLLSENITGVVGLNDAIDKEIKNIDDAKRNNQQLLLIRSQINTTTKEGADAIAEINAKLDQNTEFIRENVSASEQQKMSIGGYKEQIKGAFADLNMYQSLREPNEYYIPFKKGNFSLVNLITSL